MFIKKFSDVTDVYFFYFYNCELQIRVKTFKNKKKIKKVTFNDFYCLININKVLDYK